MSLGLKMFARLILLIMSFLFYFILRLKNVIVQALWGQPFENAEQNIDVNQVKSLDDNTDKNCFVDDTKSSILLDLFLFTIPIEVKFHKRLTGLETFKRNSLQYFTKNGILFGKVTFNVDELNIHLASSLKVFYIGPNIVFDAICEKLKLSIELKCIPVIGKCLNIDSISIDELKVKKCHISGMNLFGAIANMIFSKIIDPISFLRFFIEFRMKLLINQNFSEIIPCVQVLQYSITKLKDSVPCQDHNAKEVNNEKNKNPMKLRANFLGLEREIRKNESFYSIIGNILMKELLMEIGLHSASGKKYKRGIVLEYLNFAKHFRTDLNLGLIPPEEFGYLGSLSSNGDSDSVFESSFYQNESETEAESENISQNESNFDIQTTSSEGDTESVFNNQSENTCDIDSKHGERGRVNEIASSKSDEDDLFFEITSNPDEVKGHNQSVSFAEELPNQNSSTTKWSDLNTSQLEQSCKDSNQSDETNISNTSQSSDSFFQSEEGIKSIEYICYLDCFSDSLEYEIDLKCATLNNQLHVQYTEKK